MIKHRLSTIAYMNKISPHSLQLPFKCPYFNKKAAFDLLQKCLKNTWSQRKLFDCIDAGINHLTNQSTTLNSCRLNSIRKINSVAIS